MDTVILSYEDKVSSPARCFESPAHVLLDRTLDWTQKKDVLGAWRHDAERLSESSNEGMSGGEASRLREVALAQQQLDALVSD
jgi:hypothetical protein